MSAHYSGKDIIRAGEDLINPAIVEGDLKFSKALKVLSFWRFSHEVPLDHAFDLLKGAVVKKDKAAFFAKRLKRRESIVAKLQRIEGMKLKNMQDIGGTRAIVGNLKKLKQVVRALRTHKEFKGRDGKVRHKDYIETPKPDGYRGYHLIGQFPDSKGDVRSIELQLRTKLQHDWATTVETVDLFTGQALKSNQGARDWAEFFVHVSKQFAIMENIHLFDTLNQHEKFEVYKRTLFADNSGRIDRIESCRIAQHLARDLNVVNLLGAYANSLYVVENHSRETSIDGYALIVVDTEEKRVSSTLFRKSENATAEAEYSNAERLAAGVPGQVVALVSTC